MMTNPDKIQFNRSITPGAVPSAAEVNEGNIFINVADGIIYTKDHEDNVIPLGVTMTAFNSLAARVTKLESADMNIDGNKTFTEEIGITDQASISYNGDAKTIDFNFK